MDHFDTFKSLRFISQFIGLAPHFIHVNSRFEKTLYIKSLNYINTVLTLLIFISLTIFKNVMYKSQDPGKCFLFQLITKGNHFEVYSGIIIVFLIYSLSFIYRKELIQIEQTIYEIDRTFKKLNVTIPFKKLRKNVTLITVTLFMFDLIVLFITNVFSGDLHSILIAFIELLPGIITTVSNCYFISFMICLKYRIKSLNTVLKRNCSEYSSEVTTINQRMINENEIDMIMKIHVRICDIFDLINQYFGIILFFILSQLFILIVLFVYIASKLLLIAYIYNGDDYRDMALVIIYVTITFAFKIFFIILSTNYLLNEVENTQTFIHKTINCVQVKKLQNKLSIFLMQLINRKPSFSACGLFEINLPLLFSMIGAIFTYIIILIQFDQSDNGCAWTEQGLNTVSLNDTSAMNLTDTFYNTSIIDSKGLINFTTLIENVSEKNALNYTTELSETYQIFTMKVIESLQNITDLRKIKNITESIEDLILKLGL